jgi:type VI protein secretion system component Hcp
MDINAPITIQSAAAIRGAPYFPKITVTTSIDSHGPCFMIHAFSATPISQVKIDTLAPQSPPPPDKPLIEQSIQLENAVISQYHIYSDAYGQIKHQIDFEYSKIFWGYYPYNPDTETTGDIIEQSWDLTTSPE